MQDEINEKTIALYIKTGKLTAQTLQKAMKTLLAQMKKQKDKTPQGKQTLKQLMKQNAGVSNIEITEGNIKAFESTAKKYGIPVFPMLKTVEQMSKISGIGENKLRELMDSGELEYIQNGNRRLIADAAIWDWYHRAKTTAKPPARQGG